MTSCNQNITDSSQINYNILSGPHETSTRIDKNSVFETATTIFNGGDTGIGISATGDILGVTAEIENLNVTELFCAPVGVPKLDENDCFCCDGGLGATHFSSQVEDDIGLAVTEGTQFTNAIQLFDNWLKTYIVSTPPAPCLEITYHRQSTSKWFIEWENIPRRDIGFMDIKVPFITEMRIDYVKSSLNTDLTFTDPSTVTVNTGSTTVERIEAFTDGSGSGMVGTTIWNEYIIEPDTLYDVRIYGVNENDEHQYKYLNVFGIATLGIGVPSIPLNCSALTAGDEEINLSWDEPQYFDIDNPDKEIDPKVPSLNQYSIDYNALSSIRYGGVIPHSGTIDTGNINETYNFTSLNPGTTYEFDIAAQNVINTTGGPDSDGFGVKCTVSATTDNPPDPPELSTISLNNTGTLTYSGGGCNLEATTNYDYIYNWYSISNNSATIDNSTLASNRQIRTTTLSSLKNNHLVASTSLTTSTINAYSGLSGTYLTNKASGNLNGFGQASGVGDYDSDGIPITRLSITEDQDYYSSPTDFTGFWKDWSGYARAYDIGVTSEDETAVFFADYQREYKLLLEQEHLNATETSTQTITPSELTFVIDDLNTNPVAKDLGITDESSNGNTYMITGVPTYITSAEFNFQFTIENIARKFIRADKDHATVRLRSSSGSNLSSNLTIQKGSGSNDVGGGSHFYFEAPESVALQSYNTSTTKHNVSGNTLEENPNDIQFNDFTIGFNSNANNIFDENWQIRVIPENLYSTGSSLFASYLNTTDGTTKLLRIDTKSYNCLTTELNSTSGSNGLLVQSGIGQYPAIGTASGDAGDTYDHDADITTASDYLETLQLVNSLWQGPAGPDGFKNYNNYFYPSSVTTIFDYTGAATGGYRYTTFKFTRPAGDFGGSGVTRERVRITLENPTGLTIDLSQIGAANHRMYLKVTGYPGGSTGDGDPDNYNTAWLNCTDVTESIGIINGYQSELNTDGVACLNGSTSTVSQRDCFVPVVTDSTATFYVRIGWLNTADYTFGCGMTFEIKETFD